MSFNRLSKGFRGLLGIIKLGSYFFKVKKKNLSIFLRRLCSNCYTGFQVISLPCKSGWCPNNTSEKLGTGKPTAASSWVAWGLKLWGALRQRRERPGLWMLELQMLFCWCSHGSASPWSKNAAFKGKSSKETEVVSGPKPERKTS